MTLEEFQQENLKSREYELHQRREESCWLLMTLAALSGKDISKLHRLAAAGRVPASNSKPSTIN
ncbi:MAG: hypothetical protein P4N60_19120 [Verrucomicrobiae bacterium]|nr:hypothetical protein [Verrucomicrobiae bacterium]